MRETSSLPPPCGGAEEPLIPAGGARENKERLLSRLRFSVAGRSPLGSFRGALALAILFGAALGVKLGMRAGDLAPPRSAPIAETAWLDAPGGAEVARLRDDVRSLRAQLEQLRHLAENSRTAERLKALEAAHEGSAAQAQLISSTATKLALLEARLERIERASADATPTALIQRPFRRASSKKDDRLFR